MVNASAVGRIFTPVTAHVEPRRLRLFLDTLGETNPLFCMPAAATIPPTYLFCLATMDADDPYEVFTELAIDLKHILHGEQSFSFHAAVSVGDLLTFTSQLTSVVEKKGGAMTLIVIETAVTNQVDQHVADLSKTIVIRNAVRA